jgi:hypothetical protein
VRIVVWVAVFVACAGVGAFVAAHTNPFPPGVEDPGALHGPSPTSTQAPSGPRWKGGAGATTQHDLFVGGRCASDWRLAFRFTVGSSGAIDGTGIAHLEGALRCDFPTAQTEARAVALRVKGHRSGSVMHLVLSTRALLPPGSNEFGGFTHTLVRFPPVHVHGTTATTSTTVRASDGDRGSYVATYHVHLFCVSGC